MKRMPEPQFRALEAGVKEGGCWYGHRGRGGGAFSRMCERMAAQGLMQPIGPHKITAAGRAAYKKELARRS